MQKRVSDFSLLSQKDFKDNRIFRRYMEVSAGQIGDDQECIMNNDSSPWAISFLVANGKQRMASCKWATMRNNHGVCMEACIEAIAKN